MLVTANHPTLNHAPYNFNPEPFTIHQAWESVGRVHLILEPFTMENGLMTQTLKVTHTHPNPKPQTPNPKPQTSNLKPPNPKPRIPNPQTPNPRTSKTQTPNFKPQTKVKRDKVATRYESEIEGMYSKK